MVRAGGIARGRPDALIALVDQRGIVHRLASRVAPVLGAHGLVQPLRQRLRQSIGECLEQDGVVVVVRGLECGHALVDAVARGHRERADVVGHTCLHRRDEVGQRHVRATITLLHLLANGVDRRGPLAATLSLGMPDGDVVADGVRGEQARHRARRQPLLAHDLRQHCLRISEQAARRLAHDRILQNIRVMSGEFPGLEERRPVDSRHQILQRPAVEHRHAGPIRYGRRARVPIDLQPVRPRIGK